MSPTLKAGTMQQEMKPTMGGIEEMFEFGIIYPAGVSLRLYRLAKYVRLGWEFSPTFDTIVIGLQENMQAGRGA